MTVCYYFLNFETISLILFDFHQVVICQNTAISKGTIQGVLTHELIHMFDSCTRKLDFRNIEHLACTEIRAANLTHCGLVSSMLEGHSSIFNFRKKHQVRI